MNYFGRVVSIALTRGLMALFQTMDNNNKQYESGLEW